MDSEYQALVKQLHASIVGGSFDEAACASVEALPKTNLVHERV
jgi:hypothetical protein